MIWTVRFETAESMDEEMQVVREAAICSARWVLPEQGRPVMMMSYKKPPSIQVWAYICQTRRTADSLALHLLPRSFEGIKLVHVGLEAIWDRCGDRLRTHGCRASQGYDRKLSVPFSKARTGFESISN